VTGDAVFNMRRMREEDYAAVAAIWKSASLPHQANGRDTEERVREQLGKESSIYLVAEAGGEVIGLVLVTHDLRKGWLNRLAVTPEWQGKGVGSALVRRAEEELEALGIGIYAVLIHRGNRRSRQLFAELGYQESEDIVYCSKRVGREE